MLSAPPLLVKLRKRLTRLKIGERKNDKVFSLVFCILFFSIFFFFIAFKGCTLAIGSGGA
jgi:hypothetical protein